jgi:hypothetical protein
MIAKCALAFFTVRSPIKSPDIVASIVKELMPQAHPSLNDGESVYSSGLTAFNNMRYTFMSTIKELAEQYSINHSG